MLYDISCFFPLDVIELFARAPAERIVFASDPRLRAARHHAVSRPASRGPGRARPAGNLRAARWNDGRLARRRRPTRAHASRDGVGLITLSGRLARAYGYGSLTGPALFAGVPEQAAAMLEMALAACRDPEPANVGDALETIGSAFAAAASLIRSPEGVRPAIDLVYRAIVRAATEERDPVAQPVPA